METINGLTIENAEKFCNRFEYFFGYDSNSKPYYVYKKKKFLKFIPYKEIYKNLRNVDVRFSSKHEAIEYIYNYLVNPIGEDDIRFVTG